MATVHFHGTPIWGDKSAVLRRAVSGGGAFVSYARPDQLTQCLDWASEVAIDNGAFSAWKSGLVIEWGQFYAWLEPYVANEKMTFFVVPDVITGSESDNDRLLGGVPQAYRHKAVPVWHLHESFDRLQRLAFRYKKVCFGSSGEYAVIRTAAWHRRMTEAFMLLHRWGVPTEVHGLRMLDGRVLGMYPLHTADSTNLACNVPKTTMKYPGLTEQVVTADYVRGLSAPEVKSLVLQHRCAILRNTIEQVIPPSRSQWYRWHYD